MEEHEFGDNLAELFTVQDGVIVRTVFDIVEFNEKALDLMEGLLKGRVERKRQANAERAKQLVKRTWCDAECTFHQFHYPNGTPIDLDGNPVPVDQPYRYCHSAAKLGAPRCNDMECEVCS